MHASGLQLCHVTPRRKSPQRGLVNYNEERSVSAEGYGTRRSEISVERLNLHTDPGGVITGSTDASESGCVSHSFMENGAYLNPARCEVYISKPSLMFYELGRARKPITIQGSKLSFSLTSARPFCSFYRSIALRWP